LEFSLCLDVFPLAGAGRRARLLRHACVGRSLRI